MYNLQEMTGERAKAILADCLSSLSDIEPSEMTTFELNLLKRCADNPPSMREGIEWKLADNT